MAKNRQVTYSQALSELEKIIGEIESEEVDVDILAEKVKRAAYLIKFCTARLRTTEEEVKKALSEVAEKAETPAEEPGEEEKDGY